MGHSIPGPRRLRPPARRRQHGQKPLAGLRVISIQPGMGRRQLIMAAASPSGSPGIATSRCNQCGVSVNRGTPRELLFERQAI
jgi:hypothetical protein